MRELDVLLERYLDEAFAAAAPADRAAFRRILDLPDPDLFGYLLGGIEVPEPDLRHVVARIRRPGP